MKFISNLDQLSEVIAEGGKDPILIGGDLVFVTNDKAAMDSIAKDAEGEATYIVQPRRLALRGSLLEKKKKAYLYVAIDAQATDILESYPGTIAFSADHYLAYGLAQRAPTIIVGGGSDSDSSEANVEILVFDNNSLVATYEKSVRISSYQVDMMMDEILRDYPEHAIHWCHPLALPAMSDLSSREDFHDVGDAPFKQLLKRKLHLRSSSGSDEPLYILPAAGIVIVAGLIFAGFVGLNWMSLEKERGIYHQEISGFEDAYLNSRASLETLRHREYLLRQGPGNEPLVNKLERVMYGASRVPSVVINQIQVYPDNPGGEQVQRLGESFMIDLSVPVTDSTAELSARQVGEPIAHRISESTGFAVRLLTHQKQTISGERGARKEYWRYTFGGVGTNDVE